MQIGKTKIILLLNRLIYWQDRKIDKKISIILPTYNEAENIITLIERLEKLLIRKDYEIIVVDDNSPDGTWKRVQEYAAEDSSIKLIRRQSRQGLTTALNEGIRQCRGSIAAWMDCDLSHPPELLNDLLSYLNEDYDVVIASRYVKGGLDARCGKYSLQWLLSIIISRLSTLITRLPIKDITSGYLVVRRECLSRIGPLEGDYGEYFIDMVHKLNKENFKMKEIPYILRNRIYGESKTATNILGYAKRGLKYLNMLYKCRYKN